MVKILEEILSPEFARQYATKIEHWLQTQKTGAVTETRDISLSAARNRLNIVKEIQKLNPLIYLGGSLGLLVQGVYLEREWHKTDIDLNAHNCLIPQFLGLDKQVCTERNPSAEDVVECFMVSGVKCDVFEHENLNWVWQEYEGVHYKVIPKQNIIHYKKQYALKGVRKHINDMKIIEPDWVPILDSPDLPF